MFRGLLQPPSIVTSRAISGHMKEADPRAIETNRESSKGSHPFIFYEISGVIVFPFIVFPFIVLELSSLKEGLVMKS